MQQPGHRRLSTPIQDLHIPSSNSYRPHFGYPRNPLPLPAAYGYLPQPIWSQEYHPLPGGPRAIPLRMQRATVNRVGAHQMPIPSLQLSSNRPYSVPVYLNHRTHSDSYSSFTHPPRPATSLDLDSVDKSVPPHTTQFPQHGAAQNPENDISLHATTPADTELSKGTLRTTRPVANRGSRKIPPLSASTAEGSRRELSPAVVLSEQRTLGFLGGQKRTTSHVIEKSNSSKRIKFNVIRTQSQTVGTPRTSKKAPLTNTSDTRPAQTPETNSTDNNTTTEEINQPLKESDVKRTTAQYLTTMVDNTGPMLVSNKLANPKAADAPKPNPYDIINETDLLENSRSVRALGDVQSARGFRTTDISTDVNNRNLNTAYDQYTSVATQCGIPPNVIVSSEIQIESGKLSNDIHSHNIHYKAIATTSDEKGGIYSSENLDIQFSRIEELLCSQNRVGIDKFITIKLNSGGINVLQTLTNELLLGIAVRDVELLEKIARIM
ncbi:hypothetical protein F4813DRAFT_131138 [Daldinia decipiens]|uniref:uncharacterized protein n=1 Tax=Daldinia decipiens TaxID=326647 RepID=UPI0020C319BB|nr:uncharacterized protein F4813DRAFT_131138 [Daldinia decipiens]KAI1656308.1 hypothetical protein F4813DRAFT_131138 [Daldinia decipiens]